MDNHDYMVRCTAANQQIRAFAVTSRELVERARQIHNTSPVATAALGRLLSAGVMMGSTMKGEEDLLTIFVKGDGPLGSITVTADAKGHVKGCVKEPTVLIHAKENGKLDVSGAVGHGTLQVIRDTGLKEPYVGTIDLVSGELAEDLTYYYAVSEQVPSSVGLGVLMNRENTVRQAGGFVIQLMPGAKEDVIEALEQSLSQVHSVTDLLEQGLGPEGILKQVLSGMEPEILSTEEVSYQCNCNRERVEKALISIGSKELDEMIAEGKTIEVNCHFCNTNYAFSVEDLRGLKEWVV